MRGAVCKLPKPPGQQRGRQARRFSTEARRGTRRARTADRRAGCNFWGIPVQWEGDQGEGETRPAAASASSIARVWLSRCMKNHASRSGGAARSEQTASPYRSERNEASRFSTEEPETVENPFCMQNASCRAFSLPLAGKKGPVRGMPLADPFCWQMIFLIMEDPEP